MYTHITLSAVQYAITHIHTYCTSLSLSLWSCDGHMQCANEGPAKECCCLRKGACQGPLGICIHFYDSAPSGRYGTMSYFSHALVEKLKLIPTTSTDCRVS